MSTESQLKKLRGSGGYIMATITEEQQQKGNLGGPDLFLAPIGRIDSSKISEYYCNSCKKDYEGGPQIKYETPNEEVAENLILVEKGKYLCNVCSSTIAEYREFRKPDQTNEVGKAVPITEERFTKPPPVQTQTQQKSSSDVSLTSEIGISVLMDKRVKLDEAIDYVGLMIKNLKDKRTRLEKDIEQESVDIKNLKEKLMKVSEYIDEENQGIQNLTMKRSAVEKEADEVGNFTNSLRNKLSGIDRIIDDEGSKIKSFKESRPKQE